MSAPDAVVAPVIRTPDQRLRVFVSSTLVELAAEREVVRDAIQRLHLSPVMFELGARPYPPRELYRAYLAQSHIFIGLYWQSYGWVAPGEDVSGLEDEYRLSADLPRLIYVKDPADDREDRLSSLLDRIRADDRASYKTFLDPDDLVDLVADDLAILLTERFEGANSSTQSVATAPGRSAVSGGGDLRVREVEAPRGMVTFVSTDIEASTRLLRDLGAQYAEVLGRHRELLRNSWRQHAGYEVRTEGDSCLVAFASAREAVQACTAAQRSLATEPWPTPLRVRMAVHTGLASPHDGDYVALAVHEAARVVSAAHGGQIVVTRETVNAIGSLDEPSLRRIGRFRLRPFDAPTRLYQVVAAGLEEHFPALRAVPADGHNIVRPTTQTVGRDELIDTVVEQLQPRSLLTLIGPGGVGKTRVAAEVGIRAAPLQEDGVWMVDLAAVSEPDLVWAAVADVIGASASGNGDRSDDVADHLEDKRALLILDCCEHVAAACRQLVTGLFATCEDVAVLATSREPLRVPGEVLRHVNPLAVRSGTETGVKGVEVSPAARLFAARGAAARPGFALTEDNAAIVADICRQLDGLPLLIELAAAHLSAQSPAEILGGLADRVRLLRSADPTVPERHRSAEALLAWSYRLLDEPQRIAFRRLAIFAGGFSIATATAAVAGDDVDAADVPELLWLLVDRSLVVADLTANETRYRLLDTVRTYASRLLKEHDDSGPVAISLAGALLERISPERIADRRSVEAVSLELDNLRSVVPEIPPDQQELAQQIACAIGTYHDVRQSFHEGISELTRYARDLAQPTPTRVSLLAALGALYLRIGDAGVAQDLVDAAAAIEQEHGAPEWDDVAVDRMRGEIARRSGDLQRAVDIARAALDRPLGDRGRARMYNLLGTALAALGDLQGSYRACAEELEINRRMGNDAYVASAEGNLAEVAMRLGDVSTAAQHQRACLDLALALGSPAMLAFSLIMAARVAGARGDWATAVRLHAGGEALLTETGLLLYDDDRRESDQLLANARHALGDVEFHQSVSAGGLLEATDAAEQAAAVFEDAGRADGPLTSERDTRG